MPPRTSVRTRTSPKSQESSAPPAVCAEVGWGAGRGEGEGVFNTIVAESADRLQHRPAGHRPRVVIAALDLVVRVAARAVVATTQGGDQRQPFVDETFHDAVGA